MLGPISTADGGPQLVFPCATQVVPVEMDVGA